MWFDNEIAAGDVQDGSSDSGMSENANDNNSTVSDFEDVELLDLEAMNHVYNPPLIQYQLHHLHPILEADDETSSEDSGADFNDSKDDEYDASGEEAAQENFKFIERVIADSAVKVPGIARDWVPFDDKVKDVNITYKILPFTSSAGTYPYTNKLEYLLNVVIEKLRQHEDADIFTKLKPQRIPASFKGSLNRGLCLEVIEQRLLHGFYRDYKCCLNDLESLFFTDTFPKKDYNFDHKDSIGVFFRKLLHFLPQEDNVLSPPIAKQYQKSDSPSPPIPRKRKLTMTVDEATSIKRSLVISTTDLLNRFQAFSPSF